MKLVYVSDAIYPYNKGGKEKRLFELTTRLASLGHDVHIYTMQWWNTSQKTRVEHGVTLHAISPLYPLYKGNKRSVKEGVMFGLHCFKLFKVQFDVLDVDHMPFFPVLSAWIVCTVRRKKLHGTWHEALTLADWKSYMGIAGYIAAAIEKLSIKLPATITAASTQTQTLLASVHGRTHGVGLVTSGIDTRMIKEVRATNAACDVLFVGRLVKDKNVDKLIEAFAIVAAANPTVKCVIIGHGIEKPHLQSMINKLHLQRRISIFDPLAESRDVYSYMKRAKVFVLPSAREGFGIVALEALACGTPVVTVNEPANAARHLVIDGKSGSIVDLNPEAMAAAINTWVTKEKKLYISEVIGGYDWDSLAVKQVKVYAS